MALRSSGMPPTAVYLVKFCSIAAIAASFMWRGVLKCGSPMPKSLKSMPFARSFAASAVMAMVAEISMRFNRAENGLLTAVLVAMLCLRRLTLALIRDRDRRTNLVVKPLFHLWGDEVSNRPTQPKDFFYQPRAQIGIGLSRHHENCLYRSIQLAVHQCHLQLIFIVADSPYAAQHRVRLLLHNVIDQKS